MPTVPELLDFSKICRNHRKLDTRVTIWTDMDRSEWMRLGEIQLRARDNYHFRGIWRFSAYLSNATDFEHSPANVMSMELVGVEFTDISYGRTSFQAWIKSDEPDDFRVPPAGYNPLRHKDTSPCKDKNCKRDEPHLIIPEGNYIPPINFELFEQVKGRRIQVSTGLRHKEEE